ncbi:MAG: GntR family transcriptional regulator [Clostridiales bacterium]|nr:GntR family transcriptional regulator [Clostridiales bacterium]
MLPFEHLVLEEGVPIYLQILRYVKQGIAGGTIAHGEELPSRRMVSSLLGVNPNTVQKAYRLLEEEGLVQSHTGSKSRVVADEAARDRVKAQLLRDDVQAMISAMKQMGVTREEALTLLDSLWEKGDE